MASSIGDEYDIMEYVDEQIRIVRESDAYRNGTFDERKVLANEILSRLRKEKVINFFSYFEQTSLFSFEYRNGSIGGMKLIDFRPEYNSMPTN